MSLDSGSSKSLGEYMLTRKGFDRAQKKIRLLKRFAHDYKLKLDAEPIYTHASSGRMQMACFYDTVLFSMSWMERWTRNDTKHRDSPGQLAAMIQIYTDHVVYAVRKLEQLKLRQLNGTHGEATNEDDMMNGHGPEVYALQLASHSVRFDPGMRYSVVVETNESCYIADARISSTRMYIAPFIALIQLFTFASLRDAPYARVCVWSYPIDTLAEPDFVRIYTNPRFSQLASANGEITGDDDLELMNLLYHLILMEAVYRVAAFDRRRINKKIFFYSRCHNESSIDAEFDMYYEKPLCVGRWPEARKHNIWFVPMWVYQLALALTFPTYLGVLETLAAAVVISLHAENIWEAQDLTPARPPPVELDGPDEQNKFDNVGQLHLFVTWLDTHEHYVINVPLGEVDHIECMEDYFDLGMGNRMTTIHTLELVAAYIKTIQERNIDRIVVVQLNGVNGEATNLDDMQRGRGRGGARGRGMVPQGAHVAVNQLVQAMGQIVAGGNPPNAPPAALPQPPAAPAPNPPGHAALMAYQNLPPTLIGPGPATVLSFASFDPFGKVIVPYNVLPPDARTYLGNGALPAPLRKFWWFDLRPLGYKSHLWLIMLLVLNLFSYAFIAIELLLMSIITYYIVYSWTSTAQRPKLYVKKRYLALNLSVISILWICCWWHTFLLVPIFISTFEMRFPDQFDNSGDAHNRPNSFIKAYGDGAFLFRMIIAPSPQGPAGNDVRPSSHRNSALKYDSASMNASIHCYRHDDKRRREVTLANVEFDWRWAASNYRFQSSGIEDTISASLRAASFDNTGNTDSCRDPLVLAWFYRFVASVAAQSRTSGYLNLYGVGFDLSTCAATESAIMTSS